MIDEAPEQSLAVIKDDEDGMGICEVGSQTVTRDNADLESWANARLIAAVPDLLEACKGAEVVLRNSTGSVGLHAASTLRLAIAKATE